jgi:hypothetical protein
MIMLSPVEFSYTPHTNRRMMSQAENISMTNSMIMVTYTPFDFYDLKCVGNSRKLF